jgi:hypothetical protein
MMGNSVKQRSGILDSQLTFYKQAKAKASK